MSHLRAPLCAFAIVTLASSVTGCASRPMAPAAESPPAGAAAGSPATEATEPGTSSADATGGDAEPGDAGAEVTGGVKAPDTATSTPNDAPKEEQKPTSAHRQLETIADALDAFEEDEIRLGQLLGGQATALSANACSSICEALASMKRASDAICDLAGESDRRCSKARDKLAGNEKRIEGRGCQCGD